MSPLLVSAAIRRLNQWEDEFKVWFPDISLLGEIPITAADVTEIGEDFQAAGQIRVRKPTWPHVLAVYMAAVAARNDERKYWGVLTQSLGLKDSQQIHRKLGRLFLELLSGYALPTFEDVGGYRYVTPIRLHGGIPAYSLPDFFGDVVLPAVRKAEYAGMVAGDLIPVVLERSQVKHFVDSPVRYFLEHGGEAAENFLDRCLEMARRWEEEGGGLSASEIGLPRYVVDTFDLFMEGQSVNVQGRRLRPPRLHFAPTSGETLFSLELPEEPVSAEQAGWRYCWRIKVLPSAAFPAPEDDQLTEHVRVRRVGHELVTVGRTLPLFLPPCTIQITFEATPADGECRQLGHWRRSLSPTGEQCLLAFRADGTPLRSSQNFPAQPLLLLFPQHARLEPVGTARCVQTFPDLLGDWADWKIEEWDLSKARSIRLLDELGGRLGPPIAIQQEQAEAQLTGRTLLSQEITTDSKPLFVGSPPELWLPRISADAASAEMKEWHIEVKSRWVTEPSLPNTMKYCLFDCQDEVSVDQSGFTLPLVWILGERALGSFVLELRGPRGFQQELSFQLWSELTLDELRAYYLPTAQGPQAVNFRVALAHDHQVAVPVGEAATTVTADQEPGCFCVSVAPSAGEAVLELQARRHDSEVVRLTLRLPVPRLRWLLRLEATTPQWRMRPESLSASRFAQSPERTLVLDWGNLSVVPSCQLTLLDEAQQPATVLQEMEVSIPHPTMRRLNVNLGSILDTVLQNADVPILTLALIVGAGEEDARVPLLYLKRSLEIEEVLLVWDGEGATWLHWEAPHRLRNRRVRIWSAWRPWQVAREYHIPDDAPASPVADGDGSGHFRLPQSLPRGWYRIAFRTAHSWEELQAPSAPTVDAQLTRDEDWEIRVLQLEEMLDGDIGDTYAHRCELACIYDSVGRDWERDAHVQWLCSNLDKATPYQLVALRRWLRSQNDESEKALQMRMYFPAPLQRLFTSDDSRLRNEYLEGFPQTLISTDTARVVLEHDARPEWIVQSIKTLVRKEPGYAVDYLLGQLDRGGFSEQDAVQLLQENPGATFAALKQKDGIRARDQLMLELADHVECTGLTKVGDWVHSEAGWGRLEKIERGGRTSEFCFDGDAVRVHVRLRPDEESEPIIIDTEEKTIEFTNAQQVYHCTKEGCTGFRSYSERLLRHYHNREAHMGIGASFICKPACAPYRRPLEFSQQPPASQFQ